MGIKSKEIIQQMLQDVLETQNILITNNNHTMWHLLSREAIGCDIVLNSRLNIYREEANSIFN